MITYHKHFTQTLGLPSDRLRKVGNTVYCHLPYLFEGLSLFRDWDGEYLTFVCEGGDVCLHLKDGNIYTGNTTSFFKIFPLTEINPKIKKIFTTNLNFHHPLFSLLPVGLYSKEDDIKYVQSLNLPKENLLLANFSPHTRGAAGQERSLLSNFVKNNNWITFQDQGGGDGKISTLPVLDLLKEIAKSKYVLCPISNGYDTSRIWETLYLGAIPVTRRFPFYELLQEERLPIVILDNWSQLNDKKRELEEVSQFAINSILEGCRQRLLSNGYWLEKIKNA